MKGLMGEAATPGVKNHHRLRAGFDLRVQVGRNRYRIRLQDAMNQVRAGVEH